MRNRPSRILLIYTLTIAITFAVLGIRQLVPSVARAQDPPLGPTLVTEQAGTRVVNNTKIMNFASGCTVAASSTQANVTCTGSGGTVTSIAPADASLTFTPNPIVGTGTIGINEAFAHTWTGTTVFQKAFTSITSGTSLPWSLTPSVTGDALTGTNSATPVLLNLSPTVNLAATGGTNNSSYTAILANVTQTAIGSGVSKLLDLEVGNSSKFYVTNTGSWFSPLIDSGITMAGVVALSANTILAGAAGTGSLSFGAMTGSTEMPTGDFNWTGASGKAVNFTASGAGGIDFTAHSDCQWHTLTSGNITIDPVAQLMLGSSTATAVTTGKAGIGNHQLGMVNNTVGAVLSVSSNAIAVTAPIHHVGSGLIKNITVPSTLTEGGVVQLIPDAAFTYDATGNIVVPAGGGTAVINKTMTVVYDGSKWTPSY